MYDGPRPGAMTREAPSLSSRYAPPAPGRGAPPGPGAPGATRGPGAPGATQAPTTPTPSPGGDAAIMTQRQIYLVIIGLLSGMFLASLDQTIVSTSIRTIGDDLNGLDQQAWVTTAYLMTSTISVPIYGKLSDIFGRRPLYLFGISVFIVGSLLSTLSTSMLELAAFRAVQGLGGGALMSLPLAIMGDIIPPRERAKYQGFFLAVFGVSSVVGPLIGGLFAGTDTIATIAGWRWVFLVNVPVGLVALTAVIAFLHLPAVHDDHRGTRIDWWGAALVVVTLVPLLLVAEQGRAWGWGSTSALTCYAVSAAGLVALLFVERAMGTDAIIPLRLFGVTSFSMATVIGVFVGFAMFGAMMTIPLYLQIVQGMTPTEAGWATLPMMGGVMLSSVGVGQIIARTGKYRLFPVTGSLTVAVGYVMMTFLTADRPLWFVMIAIFFIGMGLGQLMQTLTLATQSSVQPRDMGVATAASTFFRQMGGTMGTAVLLSVLFTVMPTNIMAGFGNQADLRAGLDAALDPAVATAPGNRGAMAQIWTPIVDPARAQVQAGLDRVSDQARAGGPPALAAAAEQAHATVEGDRLVVDWSDAEQRAHWVDQLTPQIAETVAERADGAGTGAGPDTAGSTSDTSFVDGADPRLTRPFLTGFAASAVTIYWVGLGVIALAFVLALFFRPPPLRRTSALQEAADQRAKELARA